MAVRKKILTVDEISRIIEMAWEDRTPFEAIESSFELKEAEVIRLMRQKMKPSSFKIWRARVSGRKTKHVARRGFLLGRHVCPTQRNR
ncbi:MAG: TIGR03643 family protein [Gammaproteobacteria bacterium]|nr:TIGR03643 family protein [Gammaproteobacteria bacterium]HAN80779.1 TIGR03643 family protein [Gammaproteobacteria bacterium]